ncbi:tetratricopeptide repeat protein [Nodularia chucula]|uniref:tetratricopeptide repeat protein n=1 Tax=Nodularia chucula TaxID=3093667 RepID=UPI0039C742E3
MKIYHYQGRIYYEQDNFQGARECFIKVLEIAEPLKLTRAIYLNQKWLADLAIKENTHLNEVEKFRKLLKECLFMADENLDESFLAHCRASMANFEQASENFDEAKEWGELAYEDFKRLGMFVDQEEMKLLLESMES